MVLGRVGGGLVGQAVRGAVRVAVGVGSRPGGREAVKQTADAVIQEVGMAAFEAAYDECGNDGQRAIIDKMGPEPYVDAAWAFATSQDDPMWILTDDKSLAVTYQDAVIEILQVASDFIEDSLSHLGGGRGEGLDY